MNGKIYSLPLNMLLKKYYCAKCGTTLEREKTHFVVTPQDPYYYQYHSAGTFPRADYDVYTYRFTCPGCGAKTTNDQQCSLAKVQKKQGSLVLSTLEIEKTLTEHKENHHKKALLRSILYHILFSLTAFILICILSDRSLKDLPTLAIFLAFYAVFMIIRANRKRKGR